MRQEVMPNQADDERQPDPEGREDIHCLPLARQPSHEARAIGSLLEINEREGNSLTHNPPSVRGDADFAQQKTGTLEG